MKDTATGKEEAAITIMEVYLATLIPMTTVTHMILIATPTALILISTPIFTAQAHILTTPPIPMAQKTPPTPIRIPTATLIIIVIRNREKPSTNIAMNALTFIRTIRMKNRILLPKIVPMKTTTQMKIVLNCPKKQLEKNQRPKNTRMDTSTITNISMTTNTKTSTKKPGVFLIFPMTSYFSVSPFLSPEVGVSLGPTPLDSSKSKHQLPAKKAKDLSSLEAGENANVRAAAAHIIGDLIQSIGIVLVAACIFLAQNFDGPKLDFLDPCCTFLFAIIVAMTSIRVFQDCIHILMEGTPKMIDMKEFLDSIRRIPEVERVSNVHLFLLTEGKPALTGHILATDTFKALRKATRICRRHGIFHSTFQVEESKKEV